MRDATPYRALMGVRLEAVQRSLELYLKLSVAAMARQCGFASFARFSTEWRTYYGGGGDTYLYVSPARGGDAVRFSRNLPRPQALQSPQGEDRLCRSRLRVRPQARLMA